MSTPASRVLAPGALVVDWRVGEAYKDNPRYEIHRALGMVSQRKGVTGPGLLRVFVNAEMPSGDSWTMEGTFVSSCALEKDLAHAFRVDILGDGGVLYSFVAFSKSVGRRFEDAERRCVKLGDDAVSVSVLLVRVC